MIISYAYLLLYFNISLILTHRYIVSFFKKYSPKGMFIPFKERGWGREREKERDINVTKKHRLVTSCMHPPQR